MLYLAFELEFEKKYYSIWNKIEWVMVVQSEKSVWFWYWKIYFEIDFETLCYIKSLNIKLRELKKEFNMRMILGMSTTKLWLWNWNCDVIAPRIDQDFEWAKEDVIYGNVPWWVYL